MRYDEKDLFGESKMEVAIKLLQQFEPPSGYWLAFSGGKDSIVIKKLCQKSGVKFTAHYNVTTVDPPELMRFIREKHTDVIQHLPEKTMTKLIIENGTPPTRIMRYCCRYLKENNPPGNIIVTGVRAAESPRRARRRIVESCYRTPGNVYVNPIISWSNEEVWDFIKREKIPYCKLYDEGFSRIGCVGCPMGGARGQAAQFEKWPGIKRVYIEAFSKMIAERERRGLKRSWENAEEVFNWWCGQQADKGNEEQTVFDF